MTTDSQQYLGKTAEENFRELYKRTAELNDTVRALISPAWGSEMGILPTDHPLYWGETPEPAAADETVSRALFEENVRRHKGAVARVDELLAVIERVRAARDRMARGHNVDAIWCLDVLDAALGEPAPAATEATDTATEIARAALAKLYGPMADLDHPQHPINATRPANSPLLEQIAAAIGRTNLPMWHKAARYEAADAALSVVLPHGRVAAALQRSAEATVTRVIDLYERWEKADGPPLGTNMSAFLRWWPERLAKLHDAIQPADQTTEK